MAPSTTTITILAPSTATTTTTTTTNDDAPPTKPTALDLISHGSVPLPGIPTFPSFSSHRLHILQHLTGAFRHFSRRGYSEGMSGHISVRDPEFPGTFWTNPLGVHFGQLTPSSMVLVSLAGGVVVAGNRARPANAAGFFIHAAIHRARADVHAAAHAHSKHGKAWSVFARRLDMLTQDACLFHGDALGVYDAFHGVVFSAAEGERLAGALGPRGKGLVLANHGILTVGATVDEAAFLYSSLERSCEVQLMVEAAAAGGGRERVLVREEEARRCFEETSQPEALYCEFQPDYEYELAMAGGSWGEGEDAEALGRLELGDVQ